ncbi:PPE domain-containing protein, partial [Nocardia sp. NPDC003345]
MRELPKTGRRGVHDRVDPDYAPTVEVFDNLTHEQIHTGVSTLNPSVLQTSGQSWREAAGGLGDAVTQAYTEISGAIADGWRGSAAGPAAAAVRDFEAAGRALADVLATVGQRLARAGDAAETLRAAIGEPSGAVPDLADALLDPHAATGNIAVQRTTDDARADAVRVMESVYTGAFIPTGAGIPAFPDLPADPGAPVVAPATRPVTVAVAGTPVGVLVSAVAPEASDRPVAPDVPDRPEAAEAPAAQSPDGAVPAAVPV